MYSLILANALASATGCTLLSPPTTPGFSANTIIRQDVARISRGDVAFVKLESREFCDPYGQMPVIRDPRLVALLSDALWRAEYIGEQVMNRGDFLYLYDINGKERAFTPMDYPSAPSYIGPAWAKAMSAVRLSYADELRRRVRTWSASDTIHIYYPGGIKSPPSPPPKTSKDVGVPPYTGPLWDTKPDMVIQRPEEVLQILTLLSSGAGSLYSFENNKRVQIRIDQIGRWKKSSVYIVLPLNDSETSFDPILTDHGITLTLLNRVSRKVLPTRISNR